MGGEGDDRRPDFWIATPTNGHEFEQALGDDEGQRSLASCNQWGHKKLDMTEQLDNNIFIIRKDRSKELMFALYNVR